MADLTSSTFIWRYRREHRVYSNAIAADLAERAVDTAIRADEIAYALRRVAGVYPTMRALATAARVVADNTAIEVEGWVYADEPNV